MSNMKSGGIRIGQGVDVHAFEEGDHVILCGVTIPHSAGLAAHSDGDVALHALCDGLLGAAALGDIGKHFPPSDPDFKDADSRVLLRSVMELIGEAGWCVNNVDLSIKDLSRTNSKACALASVILVHRLQKYDYALKYIERGLDYNPSDSLASEFHYLKGICMVKILDSHEALNEFNQVKQYSNTYDSSLFRSAIILTYTMTDLDSAEFLLNQLTNRNNKHYAAAYFKGIIYEKRADHKNAYKIFSSLLDTPFNRAANLYHLAKSEINLNLSDSACAHLKIASEYNLKEATMLFNLYCKKESIFLSPYD